MLFSLFVDTSNGAIKCTCNMKRPADGVVE